MVRASSTHVDFTLEIPAVMAERRYVYFRLAAGGKLADQPAGNGAGSHPDMAMTEREIGPREPFQSFYHWLVVRRGWTRALPIISAFIRKSGQKLLGVVDHAIDKASVGSSGASLRHLPHGCAGRPAGGRGIRGFCSRPKHRKPAPRIGPPRG